MMAKIARRRTRDVEAMDAPPNLSSASDRAINGMPSTRTIHPISETMVPRGSCPRVVKRDQHEAEAHDKRGGEIGEAGRLRLIVHRQLPPVRREQPSEPGDENVDAADLREGERDDGERIYDDMSVR